MRLSFPRSPTRRRRVAPSSCWPRKNTASAAARWRAGLQAHFIPFTAQTRISGIDVEGSSIRKGAVDAVLDYVRAQKGVPAGGGKDGTVAAVIQAVGTDTAQQLMNLAERIAKSGGTPLAVAKDGKLLGVIHLKDIVKGGIRERFAALRKMGIRTVMITGDNPLTAAAIAAESGVDDFLAQAKPEDKLKLIRDEQALASCRDVRRRHQRRPRARPGRRRRGDEHRTMAAREAGNMVDLDSDPTKLIEIVEIGKQLLITRGALTTFSIANDVAKYFAIIPAMFVAFYPQLQALNVMACIRRRAPSCRPSSSTP